MGKKTTESTATSKKPPRPRSGSKQVYKAFNRAAVIGAGIATTRLTALVWRAMTGNKPPTSIADPGLRTREAIAWAVLVGAGAELTKVLTNRATARYWVNSTGALPPGVKPDVRHSRAESERRDPQATERGPIRRRSRGR